LLKEPEHAQLRPMLDNAIVFHPEQVDPAQFTDRPIADTPGIVPGCWA
jgi:hypothetical protein